MFRGASKAELTPAVLVLSKLECSNLGSASALRIFFSSFSNTRPRSIAATSRGLRLSDVVFDISTIRMREITIGFPDLSCYISMEDLKPFVGEVPSWEQYE